MWSERLVGLANPHDTRSTELVLKLSRGETDNVKKVLKPHEIFTPQMRSHLKAGDSFEVSLMSLKAIQELAQLCLISKGFSLIVDYGEE